LYFKVIGQGQGHRSKARDIHVRA